MLVKIHPEYGSDYVIDIPIDFEEDDGTYSIGFAIDEYICENLVGVDSYDIIEVRIKHKAMYFVFAK